MHRVPSLGVCFLLALGTTTIAQAQDAEPNPQPPPESLSYSAGDPIPDGYRVSSRARNALVAAGAIVFGVSYTASVFTAGNSGGGDSDYVSLWYPVIGPFLMATKVRSPWLALADGALQSGGVALTIVGLVWRQLELVRDDTVGSVALVPAVCRGSTGLSLVGRF
jgi:hypothetical protein